MICRYACLIQEKNGINFSENNDNQYIVMFFVICYNQDEIVEFITFLKG